MADDKRGRENQAANAEQRQLQRELEEARERGEEAEPPAAADDELDTALGDLADGLANHVYPTTAGELQETFGERELDVEDGAQSLDDLFDPVADAETYDSVDEARRRILELRDDV